MIGKTVLMPVGWETHQYRIWVTDRKRIINKQLLKDADLFGRRVLDATGKSDGVAQSGTARKSKSILKAGKTGCDLLSSVPCTRR